MPTETTPITLDYDEGIDRKTLRRLTDRFLEVNRQRWLRARSALTHRQQSVLDILPLVFHLNHPSLPGYLDSDCPSGVAGYQPDEETLGAARRLARTFRVKNTGKRRPDLDALFLMGSPGSLGHSVASDLDVWLCHRDGLTEHEVQSLERKAAKLSDWAGTLGVELHVFVFSAADWRAGRQKAAVAGENCGSAQHYLLLDEFYRTSIHLGGCVPLWWLIPPEDEHRYNECADYLLKCRFIRADEYIDFGAVPEVPPGEFLGAGVWQLYKGIDTPWKSILKLLLIECYACDPSRPLLSRQFKAEVFAGRTDPDYLDPYLLLYRRLESWLQSVHAEQRLELVRRSLYLKTGLPLSKVEHARDWRPAMLQALVREWQWEDRELRRLDNRQDWRAEDVMVMRRSIVGELTHSYRLLSRLAREHGISAAISSRDMNLLGRKLYAAFQRKAGKVEQINPGLAPSLAEENLSFLHHSEQGGDADQEGWLLFRDLETSADAHWQPVIRRSGNLTEMLVWCYLNGLLTRATRLNVRGGSGSATVHELSGMLNLLMGAIPAPLKPAPKEALARAIRPLVNLLFVNVGVDPQAHLTELGLHRLSGYQDALGVGGDRDNLVATIDQVALNSWNEVSIQNFASGDTLIQCLKNLLAATAGAPQQLPRVTVFCHTPGHGTTIARRLEGLISDVFSHFFAGGAGPHDLRYVIELGGRLFVLQFQGDEPGFVSLHSGLQLEAYLLKPPRRYAPVVFDRHALLGNPRLRAVCHAGEPDNIQVFYQFEGREAHLWVVDETGAVFGWRSPGSGRRQVLTSLDRFLENLLERRQLRHTAGSLSATVRYYELLNRNDEWVAEPRMSPEAGLPANWIEVQAMGVQEALSLDSSDEPRVRFDMYCGDQEFTVQEYGDRLIPAVSHYIHSRRRSSEPYPVYLTDLHLPHDLNPTLYQQDIPTAQYLYYRAELEAALNRTAFVQGP